MSEHKYQEAYDKGFKDGKKSAYDELVYECFEEMSPKERIEYLASEHGATFKKFIEDIKADIEAARYGLINDGLDVALRIIDKHIEGR